jgi:hypothetical protein
VAVDDVRLGSGERPAVAVGHRRQVQRLEVPPSTVLGEGERRDPAAVGDAGQELGRGRLVAAVQDRVGAEHRAAEVRRDQQRAAGLLQHDGELDEREAAAAELLRDGEALQAELAGHLLPHRAVVPGRVGHQGPHRRGGRLGGEEAAHRCPKFVLLRGEHEFHDGLLTTTGFTTRSSWAPRCATSHREVAESVRIGSGLL